MSILRGFFGNEVITELCIPEIIASIANGYQAKTFNRLGKEDSSGEKRPFLICHNAPITLKVVTWAGVTILWDFPGDKYPYPMPLREILKSDDNSITADIRISY
jgi:hypothetical protein